MNEFAIPFPPLFMCPTNNCVFVAALGERTGQICKVFFFVYCLANCTAYCLVIIDQGKAFFFFLPDLAPLIAVVLFPFSCVENVAFLKV